MSGPIQGSRAETPSIPPHPRQEPVSRRGMSARPEPGGNPMKADALRMLARQLRTDPNTEAIEDAAAALEACARHQATLERLFENILHVRLAPASDESTEQADRRIANEFAGIRGHTRYIAETTGLARTQSRAEDKYSAHRGCPEHLRSVS